MNISICMATYNGEKYIKKQLDSILSQLEKDDELIISDDSSTDKTIEIIKSYNDKKIKLFEKQNFKSPIFNFENAIKNASGDIIILADQDDIWQENKIQVIKESFKNFNKTSLKLYNGNCINQEDKIIKEDLFIYLNAKQGFIGNIIKNSFIGCNLAFTKDLLNYALPFPKDIPMHDSWLGLCAYMFGDVEFVDEKIFSYRLHENNFTSKKNSLFRKLQIRYILIKDLFLRYIHVKLKN